MQPVFPCVTLPVQASLTTGTYPKEHGVVSNGFYFKQNHQVSFWEQGSFLVQKERIWDRLERKAPELKTAVLFFWTLDKAIAYPNATDLVNSVAIGLFDGVRVPVASGGALRPPF